jgi:hypothetical protein
LRVMHPDCGHDFPPAMRAAAYALFDSVLRAGEAEPKRQAAAKNH